MSGGEKRVPKGYKQTEVGVIPENWSTIKLGDFCEFTQGIQIQQSEQVKNQKNGYIRYLYIRDFFTDDYACYVKNIYQNKIMNIGDIMMVNTGNTAGLVYSGQHGILSNNAFKITFDNSIVSRGFLFLLLKSFVVQGAIREIFNSGGQPHVGHGNIAMVSIPLPHAKAEQESITGVHSDVDVLIESLNHLISKKRAIKKGMMQELLTGNTRLPGFSGEWDVKSLGQIGEISGAGVDKKIIEGETPVRLVNYLDVYNRSFIYSDELDHHVTAPPSKAIKCSVRKGDVFFTPTSEVRDDIAVSAIAMENIPDGTYSYHVVRLRIRDDWDLNYRAYAFQTKAFLDQAAVLSDGSGTRYVISLPNFRKLKVLVPSKREQQAIGQVLSNMDAEIDSLEQRLEKTKAIKQGMMQQLLTGRIRLVDPSTPVEASA